MCADRPKDEPLSFNEQVYALVAAIPTGRVLSYGRVALLLGAPNGAREVGWALGSLGAKREPEVPWHRVVNAQGRVSIKGSPGAAFEQRRRLEAEGIEFNERDVLDMARYLWEPTPPEVEQIIAEARRARGRED